MERETLAKIIYDVLDSFQGGRTTDDSKVSEEWVADIVHDERNRAIYRYYTSQKIREKEFDEYWTQGYTPQFDSEIQPKSEDYVVFQIPKVLDLPKNAGLFYVGGGGANNPISVVKNAGHLNNQLAHRDTKREPIAHNMGNFLRIFNVQGVKEVYVRAIFERPPEVSIFDKGYSEEKQALEVNRFRRNEYYPLSGTLMTEVKERTKKRLQLAFQTPVDRYNDDVHTTDYGAKQEES